MGQPREDTIALTLPSSPGLPSQYSASHLSRVNVRTTSNKLECQLCHSHVVVEPLIVPLIHMRSSHTVPVVAPDVEFELEAAPDTVVPVTVELEAELVELDGP